MVVAEFVVQKLNLLEMLFKDILGGEPNFGHTTQQSWSENFDETTYVLNIVENFHVW